MDTDKIKLLSKYIVNFDIVCKTGLHIGGSDSGAGIGELDNPVLKDPVSGHPYICGSSLKGRMRERLEWLLGNVNQQVESIKFEGAETEQKLKDKILSIGQCNCGKCEVCHYFGHSNHDADDTDLILGPTRIIFRDAYPKVERDDNKYDQIKLWEEKLGRGVYTEVKIENTISRLTAIATPRSMERVPADSKFNCEIVIDLYHTPYGIKQDNVNDAFTLLIQGMVAIEHSFLGGLGSRGSGVVEFINLQVKKIPTSHYINLEGDIVTFPINKDYMQESIGNIRLLTL